ncbi:dioxygenase family protein [Paraburkholderia sediminicola]|uniref:dioxygenase family protein n=1 Tax=Paraburkholderia sp. D1E TaxID=3461398 RepID=UPI000EAF6889
MSTTEMIDKTDEHSSILPELTLDVIDRMAGTSSPRVRELMTALVSHLHAFVRESRLTQDEWRGAIDFLTRAGQMCSDSRQEFILLSDILGVSMLVDAINHESGPGVTDSTVLGPFYTGRQRELSFGDSILLREEPGSPLKVAGHVRSATGQSIPGAVVEVWQTAGNQLYDVQDEQQPPGHLRATFTTRTDGAFQFQTVLPVSYPIPDDGPAGQLLALLGRHPNRPAHIHFIVSAPGHRTLVTHLFMAGDEFLSSDAVFGVKPSLIVQPLNRAGELEIEYEFGLLELR